VPSPIGEHGAVLPDVERGGDGLEGVVTTRGVSVMRLANGFGARATDGGLRPPTPISVEPIGIPTLPTGDPALIPLGDEADAVATSGVVALPAQVPEAGPDTPPPSNKLVDIPESEELPGIEVPMPEDVCESEPPTPAQVAIPPIAGNVPDIVGLTPGDASSVAPIGIPDGPTGEPGPRPSGDVRPSGWPGEMLIPPTCAEAEPQPKRTAAAAATAKRVIIRSTLLDPGLVMPGNCFRATAPQHRCGGRHSVCGIVLIADAMPPVGG